MLNRTAFHVSVKIRRGSFSTNRFLNTRGSPVLQSLMREFFTLENEFILRQPLFLFLRDRSAFCGIGPRCNGGGMKKCLEAVAEAAGAAAWRHRIKRYLVPSMSEYDPFGTIML
jgi:hypothetical protein